MIQRPQTILLLVVITSLLIAATPLPIWYKAEEPDQLYFESKKSTYSLTPWAFEAYRGYRYSSTSFPYALVGWLTLLTLGLAIYEVSSFKNRTRQLKLGRLNTWLIVVMIGLRVYFILQKEKYVLPDMPGSGYRSWGIFPTLPVIALVSNLMANYFIRKDAKLVRSADRMR